MKGLKDYKDEESIELLADIFEPACDILSDEEVKKIYKTKPKMELVKVILKNHPKQIKEILLRIDDTPLNTLNLMTRIFDLLIEIMESEEYSSFLALASQQEQQFSGNAMVNTEEKEN